jgi:ferredoxin-thioredoxin reductase catalytic chain
MTSTVAAAGLLGEPASRKETSVGTRPEPSAATVEKIRNYVRKYWQKTGTTAHPDPGVTEAVVQGLAANLEDVGRPLCPCNFYPDKVGELQQHGRRWVCACDEMKKWKYCHCLLFVTPEGLPITQYLPEEHEGRQAYGLVLDPTPDKGRESGRD